MSVANQANEKLTALVALTTKIESYLNPAKKGKGNKDGQTKAEPTESSTQITAEAVAVGGMAQSFVAFFKEYKKSKIGDGENVKKLLVNLSSGIKEAADNLKDTDAKQTLDLLEIVVKGAAKFALSMILIALTAPLFAAGVLVFTLAVSGMVWVFSKLDGMKKSVGDSITTLLSLAKGAALFALTMTLIALTAPLFAAGVLVFTLAVAGMLLVFSKLDGMKKGVGDSITTLLSLAKAAALFALTMTLIALTAPLFATGVLVFTLAVAGMLLVFSKLDGMKKGVGDSITTLLSLAKAAALFSVTMVLLSFVYDKFLLGVGAFSLGIVALGGALALVGRMDKSIKKGVVLLNRETLLIVAGYTALFALAGLVAPLIAIGALAISLSMLAIGGAFALLGLMEKPIKKGVKLFDNSFLLTLALYTAVFALAGLVADKVVLGALAIAGGMLAVGIAAGILGSFDKTIKKGAGVLTALGPALIMFSAAMFILAAAPGDPKTLALKMAVVAGAIVVLGLAAYVIGLPAVAPFAIAGAVVLIALGGALLVFSAALFVLSKSNFTEKQGKNLGLSIGYIGSAIAKLGLKSLLILPGSVALLAIAAALLPLTFSLYMFKKAGWTENDGESLKNAVESVVKSFSGALDGIGIKGIAKMMAAIPAIGMIGTAITSLAMGVKAMATLTFTEMEWNEKAGKLVPTRKVKLTPTEIQAVGPNVAAIINPLIDPLTKFGKSFKEGGGFFSKGDLEAGIQGIAKISDPLTKLASMIVDMAGGRATVNEIRNGKIVKTGSISFSAAIPLATKVLDDLLKILPASLQKFGSYYAANKDSLEDSVDGIETIVNAVKAISKISKGSVVAGGEGIKAFFPVSKDLANIVQNLGPSLKTLDSTALGNFSKFTSILERLSKISSPFDRFTRSFARMSKDMGIFVKNWKQFGKDEAQNFKVFGDSTTVISKVNTKALQDNLNALVDFQKRELQQKREELAASKQVAVDMQNLAKVTAEATVKTTPAQNVPPPIPIKEKAAPTSSAAMTVGNITVLGNIIQVERS
jgi:hypothetical protein